MAKNNEITTSFNVDISELKKGISEAQRQIRLANAEFKAAASGMDQWDKSADGINAKLKQLKTVLENQNKVLDAYEKQLEEITKDQGENSKGADEMRIKIANQQAAINKTTKEIGDWENALEHVDDDIEEVGDDLEDTTNGGLDAFTVALGNLAANVITSVINKLKDLAKETIEVGKNFDSSMSNVAALSGATEEELAQLRDTAKEFGSTTKFSASEAADALGYMALAGWDSQQSMDALGGVLDLAAASGMGLAEASDMVTDYMSAFNMEAEQSTYFADMMAYAQANANTTVEGLGGAFKNCAANMNAAGQDVETVTSLLAMMANQGMKGERAGTALSAVMRDLTNSMDDGAISIGDASIEVMDAEGNYRDLTDILRDVEAATYGMGDAEKASALSSTFTSDSIKALNLILNAGVDSAADFEDELRNCEGTAKSMSDIMNDNLGGDLTALNSKIEGVQIALYEKFEPALRKGIDALDGLLDVMGWLIDNGDKVAAAIAGIATAVGTFMLIINKTAILAAFTKGITAIKTAMIGLNATLAANPIGIVIALIAGLVAAFVVLWNKSEAFRDFWITLWEAIKMMISDAWDSIKDFFENAWEMVSNLWNGAVEFFQEIWTAITGFFSGAWEFITDTWGTLTQFFTDVWEKIKAIYATIAKWVNDNIFQPIIKFFKPVIQFFTEAFKIIKELGEGCWNAIKAIWSVVKTWFDTNVIQPIKRAFSDLWEGIKNAASAAWDFIKNAASAAWEFIKNTWTAAASWFNSNVVQPITGFFSSLWEGIQTAASTAWEFIKGVWTSVSTWFNDTVVTPVTTFFTTMWEGLKTKAGEAWEGIKEVFSHVTDWFRDTFSQAWQAVKDVFSTGGKVFDGIKEGIVDAFKAVVNMLIRGINTIIKIPFEAINGMLDKIKNVEIAGVKPFANLVTRLTVPVIPELAKGGVLGKGQIGFLEGDGAEAVVPLENNKKWIAATARALKTAMAEEGVIGINAAGSQTINNNYNFVQNNTSPKALSRLEIYRHTNNQLQFARGMA